MRKKEGCGRILTSLFKSEAIDDKGLTPPSMHYIYVLKRKHGDFYIGYTSDLKRRMAEHKREYLCELVYYEAYLLQKAASTREYKLKLYGSAWRALKKRITA
ncbi:MAG: GIY-YIG nuclease family protein [Patescibacteria group bacterium]